MGSISYPRLSQNGLFRLHLWSQALTICSYYGQRNWRFTKWKVTYLKHNSSNYCKRKLYFINNRIRKSVTWDRWKKPTVVKSGCSTYQQSESIISLLIAWWVREYSSLSENAFFTCCKMYYWMEEITDIQLPSHQLVSIRSQSNDVTIEKQHQEIQKYSFCLGKWELLIENEEWHICHALQLSFLSLF